MNTKVLMIVSALVPAALGLLASFVPREILILLGSRPDPLPVLFVQLAAAPCGRKTGGMMSPRKSAFGLLGRLRIVVELCTLAIERGAEVIASVVTRERCR